MPMQRLILVACYVLTLALTQTPALMAAIVGRASISGYDGLMSLFGPNSNSNCSGAVDMNMLAKMYLTLADMKHRIDVTEVSHELVHHRQPDPVRYVNNGAGTTGTTSLFHGICNTFNVSGFHYYMECNSKTVSKQQPVAKRWYQAIVSCLQTGNKNGCNRSRAVNWYPEALHEAMTTGGTLFADSPAAEAFADILRLNPRISVMTTYRNPDVWAAKRKAEHPTEALICHPNVWEAPGVLHPFDLIGCLKSVNSDSLVGALEVVSHIDTQLLARAYIKMSTVNAYLALMSGRSYLPLCQFDDMFHDPMWAVVQTFPKLNNQGQIKYH